MHPRVIVARGAHALVVHENGLQRGLSAGREHAVDGREVLAQVFQAHGLDHLHADHRVELTLDIAVVAQLHRDALS